MKEIDYRNTTILIVCFAAFSLLDISYVVGQFVWYVWLIFLVFRWIGKPLKTKCWPNWVFPLILFGLLLWRQEEILSMLGRILPGNHRVPQEAGDLMKHYWATIFFQPLTTLRGAYIHEINTTLFCIKGILKLSAAISIIIFICSAPIQKMITICAGYQIIRMAVLVCFGLLCYIHFIILSNYSLHPSLFYDKSEWIYGLSIILFHPLSIYVAAILVRLLKNLLSSNRRMNDV